MVMHMSNLGKEEILKMRQWMFEVSGEWNVFVFNEQQVIEAYKATVKAYNESSSKYIFSQPPISLGML